MESEDNALPVPAPFMFTCTGCWQLLVLLAEKVWADAGCFAEQINLARHIAAEHPGEVPPWPSCCRRALHQPGRSTCRAAERRLGPGTQTDRSP